MNSAYQNIACGSYDELELLAIQSKMVEVVYLENDAEVKEQMIIKDVYARKGSEYLLNEKGKEIRLDQLLSANGIQIMFAC